MNKLQPPNDFELIVPASHDDTYIITSRGEINKVLFESWLNDNGKFEWIKDESDHEGNHVQHEGTYTPNEYYYYTDEHELLFELWQFMTWQRSVNRVTKLPNLTEQAKKLKSLL